MSSAAATHTIAGETLLLLAERVAYWERTRTLLVADPHFGKAAALAALLSLRMRRRSCGRDWPLQ